MWTLRSQDIRDSKADNGALSFMSTDYIERYQKLGWKLIRLNGKIPTDKYWPTNKFYPQDEEYEVPEHGNIGIQTGKISGLIVVDIDREEFLKCI